MREDARAWGRLGRLQGAAPIRRGACLALLGSAEALAFFKLFGDEITSIRKMLGEFDGTQLKDVEGLLNRADLTAHRKQKKLKERFKNTTPQGREVMLGVANRLLKAQARKERELADNTSTTTHMENIA